MSTPVIEHEIVLDSETGEVISDKRNETRVIPASDEPDYVKLYVRAWCDFKGLHELRNSDKDVLFLCLRNMSYASEGQVIYTPASMKRDIAARLGIQLRSVNNSIARLAKAGVLIHRDTSKYQVNPELVGKGDWKSIKQLRATFNVVGPNAGTVVCEIVN